VKNSIKRGELERQIGELEAQLSELPGKEREFINIKRMYELSESQYLLLMEKRTEAEIAKASAVSDIQLVNPPRIAGGAISPRVKRNYMLAAVLGLFFPFMIIFVRDKLNDRIKSKEDIDRISDIPFLGIIGHSNFQEGLVMRKKPKSHISEEFRSVRSNLQYFQKRKSNQTILITSSISGEGKSFCALNLAYAFAITGKKTLLVSADMRKKDPQLDLKVKNGNEGLSSYLAGISSVDHLLRKSEIDNLDFLPSGEVPPNPSELLMSDNMDELMEFLKNEYDLIILDTPPIGLLSDGFELMKHSDMNVFLVRQNHTLISHLKYLDEMYKAKKLRDISILLNDVNFKKSYFGYGYGYSYGYGYGYGYGLGYGKENGYYTDDEEQPGFFSRIFKKKSTQAS